MVYQSEKTLEEMKDKISDEDRSKIEAEVANVKEALTGQDIERIKQSTDTLTQAFYAVSEKLYQQAGPQDGAAPGSDFGAQDFSNMGGTGDPNVDATVVDADYTVVDDDKA